MLTTCKTNLSATEKCQETAVIHGYCYEHFIAFCRIKSQPEKHIQAVINADVLERLTKLEEAVKDICDMIDAMEERYNHNGQPTEHHI